MVETESQQERPKEVTVRYEMQLPDLLRANFWYLTRTTDGRLKLLLPLAVSLFFLFVLYRIIPSVDSSFEAYLMVVLAFLTLLIAIFVPIWSYFGTRIAYSRLKDFQKQICYTLSNRGFDVQDGKSSAHISWEIVGRVIETQEGFNIFIQGPVFYLLLKKYLENPGDAQLVREILVENLGSKAKVAREG